MNYNRQTKDFLRDLFRYTVGLTILIGFIIIMFQMVKTGKYTEAITTLIGTLSGALLTIVYYEFGDSRNSQLKDEIAKELKN